MYWFKESVRLVFKATKKELISLFVGTIFLFVYFRLMVPDLKSIYSFIILLVLTEICRYNFVADYIVKSDIEKLTINKKTISYIISKNIVSFLIIFFLVAISTMLEFLIVKTTLGSEYYLHLIILGIYIIACNNIIFIFFNKPLKLRDNDYDALKNMILGFKDWIDTIPSILILLCVYFFDMYVYKINMYQSLAALIGSVPFLNYKIKSMTKGTN